MEQFREQNPHITQVIRGEAPAPPPPQTSFSGTYGHKLPIGFVTHVFHNPQVINYTRTYVPLILPLKKGVGTNIHIGPTRSI